MSSVMICVGFQNSCIASLYSQSFEIMIDFGIVVQSGKLLKSYKLILSVLNSAFKIV